MRLKQNVQEQNAFKASCEAILLQINKIKLLRNYEVAEILGIKPTTLSRPNSLQIVNALKLLLENLELKNKLEQIMQAERLKNAMLNEASSTKPAPPYVDVELKSYSTRTAPPARRTKKVP